MALGYLLFFIVILIVCVAIITARAGFELLLKPKPDYLTFFLMGATWLVIATIFNLKIFYFLGAASTIYGLLKKEKWKHNIYHWNHYTSHEKHLQVISLSGLFILAILSVSAYVITMIIL